MLDEEEIEKINKLINQGETNYKIGMELGHSANTIKKIREEYNNAKVSLTTEEKTHFDDPIEEARGIAHNIDNLIKKDHLKAGERKEWEKRLEKIREMLRTEVDDKVASERSNAIEEKDKVWNKHIEQNYVQKEVVADLDSTIKERDSTIGSLRKIIEEKDDRIIKNQYDISQLRDYNQHILRDNNNLNEKNLQLQCYIDNRLDADVGQWQEKLEAEKEVFYFEKTDFYNYMDKRLLDLNKLDSKVNEKIKTVERHEAKLIEQEGKLKKQEAELDKNTKITRNTLEENIKAIEKREENVTKLKKGLKRWMDGQDDELDTKRKKIKDDQEKIIQEWGAINKALEELRTEEHRLQEWQTLLNKARGFNKFSLPCPHCKKPMLFDANNQKINQKINQTFGNYTHPECRPKSEQPKHVILRPVSLSGKPVIQSGFSPIIQSGGEPIVVECSGEPVKSP